MELGQRTETRRETRSAMGLYRETITLSQLLNFYLLLGVYVWWGSGEKC